MPGRSPLHMDAATLEGLIIREIRKAREISRRDLADRLEVARSTAGRRVDSLIERRLLREKGRQTRAEAGRPKRLLELCGDFGAFAGFDFDARALFATLVDFGREPIREERIPFPAPPTKTDVLECLQDTIREFSQNSRALPILGFGIGAPGRVRQEDRLALGYPYIDGWENVDFSAELNLSPSKLQVENNTRTIALGEYWLEGEAPVEHLACLSVRTGISAAVISGGRLLRGHHEMAGEIRGWQVTGGKATEPAAGWLEDRATLRSLAPGSLPTERDWDRFVEDCRSGTLDALARLDVFVGHHADAVARIVQLVDPERVVLSGAFRELDELYLEPLREETGRLLEGHYFSPPPIRFVTRGDFTGAHGAAALAAQSWKPG